MEDTIDLQELFKILKKHLVLIITLTFIAAAVSGVFTYFYVTPPYQTSTQLVLVPRVNMDTPLTQGEVNANIIELDELEKMSLEKMITTYCVNQIRDDKMDIIKCLFKDVQEYLAESSIP